MNSESRTNKWQRMKRRGWKCVKVWVMTEGEKEDLFQEGVLKEFQANEKGMTLQRPIYIGCRFDETNPAPDKHPTPFDHQLRDL